MKLSIKLTLAIAAALLTGALSSLPASAEDWSADLILLNGKVHTPQGVAEAMAVSGSVIVATGRNSEISRYAATGAKTLDLAGKAVFPGLHDLHVHPLFAGLEQFACTIRPGATPDEIASAVRQCAAAKKPGEWLLGGNWVAAVFKPGKQTRQFLDKVAPNNPVILNDESHHSVWVNTSALELAGIDRTTPNPPNGIIERDASGEATGLLRETATELVERILPTPTPEQLAAAARYSTREMLSQGITSFTVASVRESDMRAFAALASSGVLAQRVRGCIVWNPGEDGAEDVGAKLIEDRAHYAIGSYRPDCVKIFLDGVPTESRTAAMLAPYIVGGDDPHGPPPNGILNIPADVLATAVTRFDRMGMHVKFHAAGDGAVRQAIDAVFAARKANGWGGPMHDVGHSTFVDPADIPRVREAGMAWEFSPYIWYPTPIASTDILRVVGPERMERWIPIREAIDTGALVVVGSDWSVVPSVNPWLAIETLVTRQKPGGSSETLGAKERITLDEAMRIFTENGAALMGQRHQVGALAPGMLADFIVTATDPFEMPITSIHQTKVLMTFINGQLAYEAPGATQAAGQ